MVPEVRTRRVRADLALEERLRLHDGFRERVREWRRLVDGGMAWRDAAEQADVRRSVCRMLMRPEMAALVEAILAEAAAAARAEPVVEPPAARSVRAPWLSENRPPNSTRESWPDLAPEVPMPVAPRRESDMPPSWPVHDGPRPNPHIEAAARQRFLFAGPTSPERARAIARADREASPGRAYGRRSLRRM